MSEDREVNEFSDKFSGIRKTVTVNKTSIFTGVWTRRYRKTIVDRKGPKIINKSMIVEE